MIKPHIEVSLRNGLVDNEGLYAFESSARKMLDASDSILVLVNRAFRLQDFNQKASYQIEKYFERKLHRGESLKAFISENCEEGVFQNIKQAFEGNFIKDRFSLDKDLEPIDYKVIPLTSEEPVEQVLIEIQDLPDTYQKLSSTKSQHQSISLSQARIKGLLDNIRAYIWSVDSNYNMDTANLAAREMMEHSFGFQFESGLDALKMFANRPKDELEFWKEKYHQVVDKGEAQEFEVNQNFNGRFTSISAELHPIFLEGKDEVAGISCLVRNKTEVYLRNRFQKALSDFKTQVIRIDEVDELFWAVTDEILAKLHLEDAMILGLDGDSLKIRTAYGSQRLGHRKVNDSLNIKVGQGITGHVAEFKEPILVNDTSKDPRYFSVHFKGGSELAVPIIVEGDVRGLINCESQNPDFFQDIHLAMLEEVAELTATRIQQIEADERIRKIESQNRAVLNSTHAAYFLLNQDMTVESFNKVGYSYMGSYAQKEFKKGASFLDYMPEEIQPSFKAKFAKAYGDELLKSERHLDHPQLDNVWIKLTYSPAINEEGEIFGVTLIIADITKRKESENTILKQNTELKKANQELDKFVYSVSHDLRSPLSSVMGLSGLIKLSEDVVEMKQYNELINDSMIRMDSFIRNILDYSKNNRTEVVHEEVNVEMLLDDVIDNHKYIEGSSDITFRKNVNGLKVIEADGPRLRIVMNNLVSNAIKYHDPEKTDRYIEIIVRRRTNGWVQIKVKDNGQGIESQHLPDLFNMFYTANLRSSGSGIGLYILKDAINAMGGDIKVKSKLGEGSEFIINLPQNASNKQYEIFAG